jgi:ankyrin repeat protein
MIAAERDHAEVVDALVKAGAMPDIQDKKGKTALDLARAAGSLNAITALGATGSAAGSAAGSTTGSTTGGATQ